MIIKLLTEHHLEFLSLKGGCRGSSESTHVKMSHCWKSHALAQLVCTRASIWPIKLINPYPSGFGCCPFLGCDSVVDYSPVIVAPLFFFVCFFYFS